jgi:hypothetical protein
VTTIRKADLADELGVRPSAVSNWVSRGMPVQRNGLINRDRALRWINKNVEPQISSRRLKGGAVAGALMRKTERRTSDHANGDGALLDPAQERARRDQAMASKLERENDLAAGRVVLIEDVVQEFASHLAVIRSHFLALSSKLGPRLVGCARAAEIKDVIDGECARSHERNRSHKALQMRRRVVNEQLSRCLSLFSWRRLFFGASLLALSVFTAEAARAATPICSGVRIPIDTSVFSKPFANLALGGNKGDFLIDTGSTHSQVDMRRFCHAGRHGDCFVRVLATIGGKRCIYCRRSELFCGTAWCAAGNYRNRFLESRDNPIPLQTVAVVRYGG